MLEPFFKASAARTITPSGGFGLGLSIVANIVQSHGGSMRLTDGASGGLRVIIDLPAPAPDVSRKMRGASELV